MNQSRRLLLEEVRRSRAAIARDFENLRSELDLPGKLRAGYQKRPALWLGAAAALGWVLAGRKRRRTARTSRMAASSPERSPHHAGVGVFLIALAKLLLPLLKPLLTAYTAKKLARLGERLGS